MEQTNDLNNYIETDSKPEIKKLNIENLTFLNKLSKKIPWETNEISKKKSFCSRPSKIIPKLNFFQKKEKSDEERKIEFQKRRKELLGII